MELKNYLETNNMGVSEFALLAKLKQPYISLIANKKRIPSADVALTIEQATGGAVTLRELLFPDQREQK